MDIREVIKVNGIRVRLQPYTELRYEQFLKIQDKIDKYVDKNEDLTFREMPRSDKAKFWKEKAMILWEPDPVMGDDGIPVGLSAEQWDKKTQFFTEKFFEDKAFEHPLLEKTQNFFLNQEFFL